MLTQLILLTSIIQAEPPTPKVESPFHKAAVEGKLVYFNDKSTVLPDTNTRKALAILEHLGADVRIASRDIPEHAPWFELCGIEKCPNVALIDGKNKPVTTELVGQDLVRAVVAAHTKGPVIVDFSADWCHACKAFEPILKGLEDKGTKVAWVDYDEKRDVANDYSVTSLPTILVLRKDGTESGRMVGVTTEDELRQALEAAKKPPAPAPPATEDKATFRLIGLEKQIVDQTNAERAKRGLSQLAVDPNLVGLARQHAGWMARHRRLQHSHSGSAENIAMGYPNVNAVLRGWMGSRGHRANILGGYRYIGVGAQRDSGGRMWWCQQFRR